MGTVLPTYFISSHLISLLSVSHLHPVFFFFFVGEMGMAGLSRRREVKKPKPKGEEGSSRLEAMPSRRSLDFQEISEPPLAFLSTTT